MHKGSVIRKMCRDIYVLYGVFKKTRRHFRVVFCARKEQKTCMCASILGRFVFYLLLILFCTEMNILKSKPVHRVFLFTDFQCRC